MRQTVQRGNHIALCKNVWYYSSSLTFCQWVKCVLLGLFVELCLNSVHSLRNCFASASSHTYIHTYKRRTPGTVTGPKPKSKISVRCKAVNTIIKTTNLVKTLESTRGDTWERGAHWKDNVYIVTGAASCSIQVKQRQETLHVSIQQAASVFSTLNLSIIIFYKMKSSFHISHFKNSALTNNRIS